PFFGVVAYFLDKIPPTQTWLSSQNHKQLGLIWLRLSRYGMKYSRGWPSNMTGAISIPSDNRSGDLIIVVVVLIQFGHEFSVRLQREFFVRIRRSVTSLIPTIESRHHLP